MNMTMLLIVAALGGMMIACSPEDPAIQSKTSHQEPTAPQGRSQLILAGGCFWCIEPLFEMLEGVDTVEAAYVGGHRPGVNYEQVCSGATGHAEALRIVFDPKVVSQETLLKVFFTSHDPTTKDRQGNDVGTQYRSALFFETPKQLDEFRKVVQEIEAAKIWDNPIVTTYEPLKNYTRAEEYHQDYYTKFQQADALKKAGMNAGYCRVVIEPKVAKFREKFAAKLKK